MPGGLPAGGTFPLPCAQISTPWVLINISILPEVPLEDKALHWPPTCLAHDVTPPDSEILAPSSPVESQTMAFEYFVRGSALFALNSPQTIEIPVPRDHCNSYSILSRKAYLGRGKGFSLLLEPTHYLWPSTEHPPL